MTRVHAPRFRERLRLEPLEDRFLLAACHVIRLGDLNAGFDLGNGHARGDLRYCINFANNNPGSDNIDFSVTGTIQLLSKLPNLASDITLTGPGADLLAVSGPGKHGFMGAVFFIDIGARVTISGLTITKGYNEIGPGGISNHGTLTLTDSTVANNYNYYGTSAGGGGIRNSGNMTITGTTVSGNECLPAIDCLGGGIFNKNTGVMQVQNSTISGNWVDFGGDGAGIFNQGSLDIRFSTVTNNTSVCCGASGIQHDPGFGGSLYLYNTIVAGNNGGAQVTGGYTGSSNLIGGDPKLGVLQYNGGPTQTHKVLQMSPALNAGDNTGAPEFDQRGPGFPRVVNGTVDIGAYEAQGTPMPSLAMSPEVPVGLWNLRVDDREIFEVSELTKSDIGRDKLVNPVGLTLADGNGKLERVQSSRFVRCAVLDEQPLSFGEIHITYLDDLPVPGVHVG